MSANLSDKTIAARKDGFIGLDQLNHVELGTSHQQLLDNADKSSVGPAYWQARKRQEVRTVLALAQVAPRDRFRVLGLDMTEDVQMMAHLNVTVGCMAPEHHRLTVFTDALLVVRYPQRVMITDLPGTSFVQVRQPRYVWHANVDHQTGGLCLGLTLPRNIPLVEIIWLSYTALTMQTWMFDESDTAGVLNREAARWWTLNQALFPLTRTALLEDEPLVAHAAKAAPNPRGVET